MWKTEKETRYQRIEDDEHEPFRSRRQENSSVGLRAWDWRATACFIATLSIGMLLGSVLTNGWHHFHSPSQTWLLKRTNTFSPFLERHDISSNDATVNGSIFNNPYSIYRAPPSKEVDAAWDAISEVRPFAISSEEVRRLGKDPSQTVRVPEDWGLGSDMHFGELDSQHLLHCLNALRKYTHHDYYFAKYSNSTETLPRMQAVHRDHCLGILLQTLTCQPSLNVLTFDWMETQNNPFPDFAIRRKCVDHGRVLEWQKEAEVEGWEEKSKTLTRPAGAKTIPALKGLLEIGAEREKAIEEGEKDIEMEKGVKTGLGL